MATVTQTIQFSRDVLLKSVPAEAFVKSESKAAKALIRVGACVFLSYAFLIWSPWYLLPIAWALAGTALTGLFSIAHDCGHNAFFEDEKRNYLVGSLAFLPLLYPLESWKLHHTVHHQHAEERSNGHHQQRPKKFFNLVNPIFWVYYLGSYFIRYFDLSQFPTTDAIKARTSVLSVYAFGAVLFSGLFYFTGVWGIFKFWVLPWFILHFWKNTFRQYLMRVIDWKGQKLVHYKYPDWVEFLAHDANYLIPHYLSTNIPIYNNKLVHQAIMASEWGRYVDSRSWTKLLQEPHNESKKEDKEKFQLVPFLRSLNWLHIPLLISTPLIALYGAFTTDLHPYTFAFGFAYYLFSGLGITAGYHRLWAHRAYDASLPVRVALCMGGTAAVEGSIRWWCRDHRAHHRYTDTPKDPYSASEGFWWAHMGWMLKKQNPKTIGFADISDLNADPLIRWQHRNYLALALIWAIAIPTFVCGLGWGDWRGGYFYAAVLRLVFVHHATFCVNSLAHHLGAHTYSDKHTPRDSIVTALLTFGEGYHNFHHEFPNDYRNGIKFYHYDPTKWLIRALAFFGLTYNLKVFPANEVEMGRAQMAQKNVEKIRKKINWGPDVATLPLWTQADVNNAQSSGKNVIIIDNIVHDVTVFVNNHPGGSIIKSYVGTDATAVFYGGVYDHSNAAQNLLSTLRLARYQPDASTESLTSSAERVGDKKND